MAGEDEIDMVDLGMVCTCDPAGAERAKQLMESVLGRLSEGSKSLRPRAVTRETFLSEVCLSLRADYRVLQVKIWMGQWFGIVVEQLVDDDEREIVVQADAAEDGLAAIWAYVAEEAAGPAAP